MQKLKVSICQIKRSRISADAQTWKRAPKPIEREWNQSERIPRIVWQY